MNQIHISKYMNYEVIVGTEEALYVLSVGGAALSNIDSNIKDCAFDAANEFALGEGRALEMEASHYTVG